MSTSFPLIWHGDLVSDIKWPRFKLDLAIIKTNILSNIYDNYLKNVTSVVLTRFPFDQAWWPRFWPHVTQFQTWPRTHEDKHLEQDSWWLLHNVTAIVFTTFYTDVARWPSFWPHVTQFQTWPRNHQDKHFEQDLWWLLQKCDRWSVSKVFCWFGPVT